MQAHMTNTRNTPVESFEHAYPLRVRSVRIRRGSGGRGLHTGGDGIERTLELLVPTRVTVISERRTRGPWGLKGGEPGAPGSTRVTTGKRMRTMPGKFTESFPAGAVLTLTSPGGGGFGRAVNPNRGTKRAR